MFEDDKAQWMACFTERELGAMEKFHVDFDRACEQLPGYETGWRDSEGLRQAVDAAKLALEEFDPDV